MRVIVEISSHGNDEARQVILMTDVVPAIGSTIVLENEEQPMTLRVQAVNHAYKSVSNITGYDYLQNGITVYADVI